MQAFNKQCISMCWFSVTMQCANTWKMAQVKRKVLSCSISMELLSLYLHSPTITSQMRQAGYEFWIMMLYHGSLSIVLVHIICYICESAEQDNILRHDDLSEEIREDATAKLSSFLENNSMKSLPVHSREVRPASCSEGVEEEFILYRLRYF